jgi:hypothetical protein
LYRLAKVLAVIAMVVKVMVFGFYEMIHGEIKELWRPLCITFVMVMDGRRRGVGREKVGDGRFLRREVRGPTLIAGLFWRLLAFK